MSTRIEEHALYIHNKLSAKNIKMDVNDIVEDLKTMKCKRMERLNDDRVYEKYLDHKTVHSKIFERIKNGEDVIYDMKLCLNRNIDGSVLQEYDVDSYLIYNNTLYIKFGNDFFDDSFDIKKVKRLVKHCDAYRTDEVYFNVEYRERNIILLVQILKKVNLPLKIVYYENCDNTVFLHMEDRKWPHDNQAIECVKSALLCHIYSHCKLSYGITREAVFLKLNDKIYKVMIKYERSAATCNLEKRNEHEEVHSSAVNDQLEKNLTDQLANSLRIYKTFETGKKIAKEYIKLYLDAHGYFPFYIKNYEIDELIAEISAVNPGQIFIMFIKLPKQQFKSLPGLDSILLNRLIQLNAKVLEHLQQSVFIDGRRLLSPSLKDYDFVLMKENTEGQSERIIFVADNDTSKFLLGQVEVNDFFGMGTYAYLLYSEYNQVLMVKMKDMKYISLVMNVLLVKTSFSYVYKNF